MTYPLVKFVDAPDPAANVRYDCNRVGEDGVASRLVMAEGFTLGTPTLEGDPDAVGTSFGLRAPSFTQRVKGSKAEALAALSSLSRELLRPTNWVLVQVDAFTSPIWLKTYRAEFAPLSLAEVYVNVRSGDPVLVPDTWEIAVPLLADAFAYGARETLDSVTVTQAPDGTNPMQVLLPAIKGDAPTPLRVVFTPQSGNAEDGSSWLLANLAGDGLESPVIDIGTGDGFTAGSGTAAASADVLYFGDSYRAVTVSSGANLVERLSGTLPVAPPPGRYKVLLRCQTATTTATKPYLFALSIHREFADPTYHTSVQQIVNPEDSASAIFFRGWVDLGDFAFPPGVNMPSSAVDPGFGTDVAADFSLKIGTADESAGSINIDAIKLIPLDGQSVENTTLLAATFGFAPIFEDVRATFDGDTEAYWATYMVTGNQYPGTPALRGGFPVADPLAAENLLVLMATDHGAAVSGIGTSVTTKGVVVDLIASYHPRYLHIGDGT